MDRCQILAALQFYSQTGPAVFHLLLIGLIDVLTVQVITAHIDRYGTAYQEPVARTGQVISVSVVVEWALSTLQSVCLAGVTILIR